MAFVGSTPEADTPEEWDLVTLRRKTTADLNHIIDLPEGDKLPEGTQWGDLAAGFLEDALSIPQAHVAKASVCKDLGIMGLTNEKTQLLFWSRVLRPMYKKLKPAAAPVAPAADSMASAVVVGLATMDAYRASLAQTKVARDSGQMSSVAKKKMVAMNINTTRCGEPKAVFADLTCPDLGTVDPAALTPEEAAALAEAQRVSPLPPSEGGPESLMYPLLVDVLERFVEGIHVNDVPIHARSYNLKGKGDLAAPLTRVEVKKTYTGGKGGEPDVELDVLKFVESTEEEAGAGAGEEAGADAAGVCQSTDGPFELASQPMCQVMAQSDADMWQSDHRPRLFVLTDALRWRIGVHTVEDRRNIFRVDHTLYTAEEALPRLKLLHVWAEEQDPCKLCVEDPSVCRPPQPHSIPNDTLQKQAWQRAVAEAKALIAPLPVVDGSDPVAFDRALEQHNTACLLGGPSIDRRDLDFLEESMKPGKQRAVFREIQQNNIIHP